MDPDAILNAFSKMSLAAEEFGGAIAGLGETLNGYRCVVSESVPPGRSYLMDDTIFMNAATAAALRAGHPTPAAIEAALANVHPAPPRGRAVAHGRGIE